MAALDIVRRRLHTQGVVGSTFDRPADVVAWLGAVQAQDYRGGLWGIGLRTKRATEADVEQAIADRAIVRTWPMRGTLHLVAAADVRWMTRLLAPRVLARAKGRYRELGLDDKAFRRSRALVERALPGKRMTRDELYALLDRGKVATAGQRGIHILGHLAMQGLLCLAAHRGKQPTFALFEEWVPEARSIERDEALAELARRYFVSHGPATLHDFAWWTGLPLRDAKAGLDPVRGELEEHVIEDRSYFCAPGGPLRKSAKPIVHLLPPYDEYTVAYRDRAMILDPAHAKRAGNGIFSPVVAIDGRVAGTWKRAVKRDRVVLTASLFAAPSRAEQSALRAAVERYGRFTALEASIEYGT